ncbi:MAG: pseudaminic acid synthase [Chlamydiia bacterium]|nr:pseudaminic acid synthase [Chlamydiia bacterium]
MAKQITVGKHTIGMDQPPFIVAEMSGNHNHSLDRALKLVEAAANAGVQAIKLQTYTPDTMTLDIKSFPFLIEDPKSLWNGKTLYELYQEATTPWEWHEPIFRRAKELGLIAFSTPFDATSVDFLESLPDAPPCYKIASLEIVDHDLIAKVASTKKPLIISTGASTLEEIKEAVAVAKAAGCRDLILLKCTSAYPANPQTLNLRTLPHLAQTFDTLVGFSDHSLGIGSAIASIALGGCLIEKHITLARSDGGVDAAFSLEPAEFRMLVTESVNAWKALGKVQYGVENSEKTSFSHRRSLYFVKDLKKGEEITKEHIRAIRPGFGLPPKHLKELLGKKVQKDIKRGDPVKWDGVCE